MPTYTYVGRSRGGKLHKGELLAANKNEAIAALRKQQILVTVVNEKGKEERRLFGRGKVKQKELAVVTRQLSFMIDAGLPLNQALEIIGAQVDNKALQKVLFEVRQSIEGGSSFSDSLSEHPQVFNELYTNMIAAGEAGGILDTILERLSSYIEKNVKLVRAVKSALVYPISVITIAVGVVIVILWQVIPTFAKLFTGLGRALPVPTQITIDISNFLGNYILFIIGAIVALVFTVRWYYTTPGGKLAIDSLLLRLPVLGIVLRKIAIARFCRTLGTLIGSGVPILDSLDITARTAGNKVIENAVKQARESVETGKTLSEPLRDSEVFTPMVVQMVNVGEQTGELDAMVNKVAEFYEAEVDAAVQDLLALMEPLIIIFLGVTIGWIVVSMYMPIFTLIGELS
jgi:type IV pilus assembly protein PilC